MTTIEFTVPENCALERLDSFLSRSNPDLTRSAIQRLIEAGEVRVNDQPAKPSLKLKGGEQITLDIPAPAPTEVLAEAIPLEILYEDPHVIVVNKPAGMVVHPAAGNPSGTLVNALLGHCHDLSGIGGELRPGIVHRIDKGTSGILVVAKNDGAHQSLSHQFKEHSVKRVYLALVYGSPKEDKGKIDAAIGRHPVDRKRMSGKARQGKRAVTHWRVTARYGPITLLTLRLETGRTHQIRVHMTEAGFPLVGDEVYGGSKVNSLKDPGLQKLVRELGRQALHAKMLGFIHPVSNEYLEFDTELPADMAALVQYLAQTSGSA
jgi:23S rRNA pseudouridine1911/1915/1917 synthase